MREFKVLIEDSAYYVVEDELTKTKFKVLIEKSACYVVKDENNKLTEADARRIAEGWFIEKEPTIHIEELEPSSFDSV